MAANPNNPVERQRQARFVVLSKLSEVGTPANFLEMGFNASPQALKNMAAHGLIRITVEATDRGRTWLEQEQIKRKQAKVNSAKQKRIGGAIFGNPDWSRKEA